eukprot:522303-Prymnesium_polylepis.1
MAVWPRASVSSSSDSLPSGLRRSVRAPACRSCLTMPRCPCAQASDQGREVAVLVYQVDGRPRGEQEPDALRVTLIAGKNQRRVAVLVYQVDGRTGSEQQLNALQPAVVAGHAVAKV